MGLEAFMSCFDIGIKFSIPNEIELPVYFKGEGVFRYDPSHEQKYNEPKIIMIERTQLLRIRAF